MDDPTSQYPGMPRWVKLLAVIAAVLLLAFLVIGFFTGGHGPQRHRPDAAHGSHAPPAPPPSPQPANP